MQNTLVVGGDRRMALLAQLLEQDGWEIQTLGLRSGDEESARPERADRLLFPYPFSTRNQAVPTLTGISLLPENVLSKAKEKVQILAGQGLDGVVAQMTSKRNVKHYAEADGFLQRNAELSAEAAVFEAMQKTGRALLDMKTLVTGYGCFGRALALRLKALGAWVTVAARREEVRRQVRLDGMEAIALGEMEACLSRCHLVLNTIPAQIMDEKCLASLSTAAWLLELASAPYGFERATANRLGIQYDILPALPARYAPISAALALKRACLTLVKEDA